MSVNPAALNLDEELRRFEYKVEAGAEFVLTRPIFDVAQFERSCDGSSRRACRSLAGVFPFESARNAEFMANEVPGVRVPDALLERMRRAEDGGSGGVAEGIAIALEIARALEGLVQGAAGVHARPGTWTPLSHVVDGLGGR